MAGKICAKFRGDQMLRLAPPADAHESILTNTPWLSLLLIARWIRFMLLWTLNWIRKKLMEYYNGWRSCMHSIIRFRISHYNCVLTLVQCLSTLWYKDLHGESIKKTFPYKILLLFRQTSDYSNIRLFRTKIGLIHLNPLHTCDVSVTFLYASIIPHQLGEKQGS